MIQIVRLGVVLGAMVFFFMVVSGSLRIGEVDVSNPWAPIANIMVFAGLGIFLLFFAFILTRTGG